MTNLKSISEKCNFDCGNLIVVLHTDKEGNIKRITLSKGKHGGCMKTIFENIQDLINLALEHFPAEVVVKTLKGGDCKEKVKDVETGKIVYHNCIDAIAVVMDKHIKREVK